MILIDTNVLMRLTDETHDHYAAALNATHVLGEEHELVIVPQNLYEFWVACTRPATAESNGLGWTAAQADAGIEKLLKTFTLMLDERAVYRHWRRLVADYGIVGRKAHDARLVAAMQRHGIDQILTFNVGDFKRYDEITVIDPADLE